MPPKYTPIFGNQNYAQFLPLNNYTASASTTAVAAPDIYTPEERERDTTRRKLQAYKEAVASRPIIQADTRTAEQKAAGYRRDRTPGTSEQIAASRRHKEADQKATEIENEYVKPAAATAGGAALTAINPALGYTYFAALAAPGVYHNPILHGEVGSADDYANLALASTFLLPVKVGKVPTRSTVARHGLRKNLFNNSHPQGDQALKMFQQYAQKHGSVPLTEGSINAEQIRAYVPELRERFGLIGNTKISDAELEGILNAKILETAGNTGAVNANGEPQLLFRGDTLRYHKLKHRWDPEKLAEVKGDMDNSLGNLFLGELPGTANKHDEGIERYLVTGRDFDGEKTLKSSGTGSRALLLDGSPITWESNAVPYFPQNSRMLVSRNTVTHRPITTYKLPPQYSESGINDINGFVVRTPSVRDASREISVLNDNLLAANGSRVDYYGPTNNITDALGNIILNVTRPELAQHYRYVLDDAKYKNLGLLKSDPNSFLRDEHTDYTYFALPNFNILGAKHVLPYNFNRRRNFNNPNIYKRLGGKF